MRVDGGWVLRGEVYVVWICCFGNFMIERGCFDSVRDLDGEYELCYMLCIDDTCCTRSEG